MAGQRSKHLMLRETEVIPGDGRRKKKGAAALPMQGQATCERLQGGPMLMEVAWQIQPIPSECQLWSSERGPSGVKGKSTGGRERTKQMGGDHGEEAERHSKGAVVLPPPPFADVSAESRGQISLGLRPS